MLLKTMFLVVGGYSDILKIAEAEAEIRAPRIPAHWLSGAKSFD